jgi:hypothetical protein
MASPESNRIGGARVPPTGGGGVKNLLAMFEKGGKTASPAPSPTISREISPGPKPLGRVRTSFVAIGGKDGVIGLQKIPISPDVSSPINSSFGPYLGRESPSKPIIQDVKLDEPSKKLAEPSTGGKIEELKSKTTPTVRFNAVKAAPYVEKQPSPSESTVPKQETKREQKQETKSEQKQESNEESKREPTKVDHKPQSSKDKISIKEITQDKTKATTKAHPPSTAVKAIQTVPVKSQPALSKPGKTSVIRKKASAVGLNNTTKSKQTAPTAPPTAKPVTRPRQHFSAAPKPKPVLVHKPVPKPEPRETTKPVILKGTAFGPTASWVAKHGGPEQELLTRRPPSATSHVKAKSPTGHTLRRKNSTISDRGRNVTRSPVNNTSTYIPPAPSSDFLSRMMRPTKSSANKIHEKAEIRQYTPPFRAGSSMGGRRNESPGPISPPRKSGRAISSHRKSLEVSPLDFIIPSDTRLRADSPPLGENVSVDFEQVGTESYPESQPPVLIIEEGAVVDEKSEIVGEAMSDPIEDGETIEYISDPPQHDLVDGGFKAELDSNCEKRDVELTINTTEIKCNDDACEEGHTPTTTSSSATLVHEGEALDMDKLE